MELKKVNEDKRGEIWTLTDDRFGEMTILFTKAGFARGGCVHDQPEKLITLTGEIIYYEENEPARCVPYYHPIVYIDQYKAHGFKSVMNSVVLEIKSVVTKTKYDPQMRKKVEDINAAK